MSNISSTSFEHAISDGSMEQLSQPNRHANRVRINGRKNPAIPPGILPANHRRVSAEHVEPFLLTSRPPRLYSNQRPSTPAGNLTGNDRLPFEPRPKQNQSDLWHHGLTAVEQAFASNYVALPGLQPPPPPLKAGRPKLTIVIPETPMLRDSYAEAQRHLEEGGFTSGSSTGNSTANSYGTYNRWDTAQLQIVDARVCVYDTKVYVLKTVVAIAFIFGMGFWFALAGSWD